MQLHGGADSNEKTRQARVCSSGTGSAKVLEIALRQLSGRSAWVLGNDLLEDTLGLVVVTQRRSTSASLYRESGTFWLLG